MTDKRFDGFDETDTFNGEKIEVSSISTDTVDTPSFEGLECISCGVAGHTIPVWEDMKDYHSAEPPDYIGCTNCHNMLTATSDIIEEYFE